MRAFTCFHTNAATANRMILRMIDFLSGLDSGASVGVCLDFSTTTVYRVNSIVEGNDSPKEPPTTQPHVGQRRAWQTSLNELSVRSCEARMTTAESSLRQCL
jgi:hypothetical protein